MNIFTVAPKASQLYGYDIDSPSYQRLADFYKNILKMCLDRGEKIQAFNGGLLGADLAFAKVCADMRDAGADIFCYMYIPYAGYNLFWDQKNRELSSSLVRRMDSIKYDNKEYTPLSIQQRNNWFISRSDVCLAIYGQGKNEVWRVMNESLRHKLKVIQFNFATGKVSRYRGIKTLTINGETSGQ